MGGLVTKLTPLAGSSLFAFAPATHVKAVTHKIVFHRLDIVELRRGFKQTITSVNDIGPRGAQSEDAFPVHSIGIVRSTRDPC